MGSIALLLSSFSPLIVFAVDGPVATQQINMSVGGSSLIAVDGGPIGLSLDASADEAGESLLSNSHDETARLRVSSYITTPAGGEQNNKITAKITTGDLYQSHTKLYVRLLAPTGPNLSNFVNYSTAGGTLQNQGNAEPDDFGNTYPVDAAIIGTSTSSTKPEVILVRNIGFCWSGTDHDDGYIIQYTYAPTNTGGPQARSVTITYTIAADI